MVRMQCWGLPRCCRLWIVLFSPSDGRVKNSISVFILHWKLLKKNWSVTITDKHRRYLWSDLMVRPPCHVMISAFYTYFPA